MATRISQEQLNKFISPEAAMAPYERAQKDKQQRVTGEQAMAQQQADADARLAQLIQGKGLDQENEVAKLDHQQAIAQQAFKDAQGYIEGQAQKGRKVSASFGPQGATITQSEMDPFAKQLGSALRTANITGFDIADPVNVIPSAKDAETVKKSAAIVKQAQGELPATRGALGRSGSLDRFGAMNIGPISVGTESGRDLEQKKTSLLSYAQKLADTGVLQPGELPLLNKRVGELTGIGAMFRKPDEIMNQLNALEADLINKTQADATARGYKAQPGYLAPSAVKTAPPSAGVPSFEEWKSMKRGQK